jgi:hypothetical protein
MNIDIYITLLQCKIVLLQKLLLLSITQCWAGWYPPLRYCFSNIIGPAQFPSALPRLNCSFNIFFQCSIPPFLSALLNLLLNLHQELQYPSPCPPVSATSQWWGAPLARCSWISISTFLGWNCTPPFHSALLHHQQCSLCPPCTPYSLSDSPSFWVGYLIFHQIHYDAFQTPVWFTVR